MPTFFFYFHTPYGCGFRPPAADSDIPIISGLSTSIFPDSQVFQFAENVASMSSLSRSRISEVLALPCYSICPSVLSPVRRPRLYWFDWTLSPHPGFPFPWIVTASVRLRSFLLLPFRTPSPGQNRAGVLTLVPCRFPYFHDP